MSLSHLIYLSSALKPEVPERELQSILNSAVRHNLANEITGMLLYSNGGFMQLLEGEEAAIQETYSRIEQDTRHKSLILLLQGKISNRTFPNWSMGYIRNAADCEDKCEGNDAFRHNGFDEAKLKANPGLALDMLRIYSGNNKLVR